MSEEEQLVATGRLITEATESKKRVALLHSNMEALSGSLEAARVCIQRELQSMPEPQPGFDATVRRIPSSDKVTSTCNEYRDELKRFKELKQRVAAMGLQL